MEFGDCCVPFSNLCWILVLWVYLCIQGCPLVFLGCVSNNIWQFRVFGYVITFLLYVLGVWVDENNKTTLFACTKIINIPIKYNVITSLVRWPKLQRKNCQQVKCELKRKICICAIKYISNYTLLAGHVQYGVARWNFMS